MNNNKMDVIRKVITIREIFEGYKDMDWDGVVGYGGKLDIRPEYQREFIYDLDNERAVIETILNKRPLNLMYWVKNRGGNFELLDGQQRTLSICHFLDHKYYILDKNGEKRYEDGLFPEEKERILNYELDVYICDGSEEEVLDWFKTINIKGKELNEQEKLNATHTGPWLSDAKRYFSKPNCAAYNYDKFDDNNRNWKYIGKSVERQEYLSTVLDWVSGGDVQGYMSKHRYDNNAVELWEYYLNVIDWVREHFSAYFKEMKGLPWGRYYNKYGNLKLDPVAITNEVNDLMGDEEVENKRGIFEFVLEEFYRADTGEKMTNGDCEKFLHIRQFDPNIKRSKYAQQNGICPLCNKHFDFEQMHGDRIKPWSKGGKTTIENCQMLCATCNLKKSNQM